MRSIILIFAAVLVFAGGGRGQTGEAARDYFGDTPLVDQDGRTHKFYSGLMHGKVVIITPFHTDCDSTVPPIVKRLVNVRSELGDRAGEVNFLLLSVDPKDTPAKSRQFAEMTHPSDERTVTGDERAHASDKRTVTSDGKRKRQRNFRGPFILPVTVYP